MRIRIRNTRFRIALISLTFILLLVIIAVFVTQFRQYSMLSRHIQHLLASQQRGEETFQQLIDNTNLIKYEMIGCISLLLIMLVIIVCYQYFMSQYERQLGVEKLHASQLAQEKTELLSTISHEIRNPLNSLLGIIGLIKQHYPQLPKREYAFIEECDANIRSITHTINDILATSKRNAQSTHSAQAIFHISSTVETTAAMYQQEAAVKNLQLQLVNQLPKDLQVMGVELKIKQVLINIISNAIKYSHQGVISYRASIRQDGLLTLEISDQGIGIPNDLLGSIFERFYTVHKGGQNNIGLGLGLYITQQLVSEMQGDIQVSSVVGQGTRCTIRLPLQLFATPHSLQNLTPKMPHQPTILVVDDHPINRLAMQQQIQQVGTCYTAQNAREALAILSKEPIELIITDLYMPEISGIELLFQLRKDPKLSAIPVICSTGAPEQMRALERQNRVFFDEVLVKPISEQQLMKVITKLLPPQK